MVRFGSGLFCQRLRLRLFHFFFLQPLFLTFQPVTVHSKISTSVGPVHCSRDLQTSFFSNFFIKNGFHGIIYTFKYYFAIVFSIFSFSKNKLYLNGLNISISSGLSFYVYVFVLTKGCTK